MHVVKFEDDGGGSRQRRRGDSRPAGQDPASAGSRGREHCPRSLVGQHREPAGDDCARFLFGEHHGYLLFEFRGLEAERAPAPFVRNFPALVDEIQAVGHAAVEMADAVVHLVHDQRALSSSRRHSISRRFRSARRRSSVGRMRRRRVVRRHPPAVGRVCFADVDVDELNPVAVLLVQPFEVPKLGTVRPSGKAPEDEHHRFLAAVVAKRDRRLRRRGLPARSRARSLRPSAPRAGANFASQQSEKQNLLRRHPAARGLWSRRGRGVEDPPQRFRIDAVLSLRHLLEKGGPFRLREFPVAVLVALSQDLLGKGELTGIR